MAVVVPIAADYDSSGIKEAQKSIANFGQSISKSLQQAGREAKRAFDQIEAGTEDSRTAAQRLAASLDKVADTLEADLKASTKAVDALAQALGPDMAKALGQNGLKRLVTDLNRAGLTMEEIQADAGTLAASLKRLDDVNLSAVTGETKQLNAEVGRTSAEAERARGVFGGFVGGATSEIPGLTGAFQPLVQAIDQTVSGLVEGTFAFRQIVTFAAPMAAVAGAMYLITDAVKNAGERAKFTEENVESLTESLVRGETVAKALAERFRELGQADVQIVDQSNINRVRALYDQLEAVGGVLQIFGVQLKKTKTVDLTQDLVTLGLNADKVANIIAEGPAAISKYVASLRKLGLETVNVANVEALLIQKLQEAADAQKAAQLELAFTAEQTSTAYNGLNSNITAAITGSALLTTATAALAGQQERNAAATAAAAKATDDARQAFYRSVNAVYAYEDSHARAADAVDAAAKAEAKAAKTRRPKDIEEATRLRKEATRAVSDASAAAVALEDATNKTTDEQVRQTAITAAGQRELENFGHELRTDSELMRGLARLLAYYQQLTGTWRIDISPSTVTPTGPAPTLTSSASAAGGASTVNITVNGSILTESDLADVVQRATNQRGNRLGE